MLTGTLALNDYEQQTLENVIPNYSVFVRC